MAARLKAGSYHLTEEQSSASVKAEQQRRRALRWEEVRAQSRSHAAEVRQRVQQKKAAEVKKLHQRVEQELEAIKDIELQNLGFQYQGQLMDVGKAFVRAETKGDFAEAKERNAAIQRATARARGAQALEAVREEQKNRTNSASKHTACLKASREAEKVRAAGVAERDTPQPGAVDLLFTSSTRSPSKGKACLVHAEDSSMASGKPNPIVRALAEMSTIQKEIFGDVESIDSPDAPKSPTKSAFLRKGAVIAPASQNSLEQQARLRSSDAARKEQRRKNAQKLFEDLERMEKQMLAKYSECKENVEANIVDKMDDHIKALLFGGGSPQLWKKQTTPRTAIPLSSPKRPLFRQAVHRSSRKASLELAMTARPLPAQAPSSNEPSVTLEGEATDGGTQNESSPSKLSPSFDSSLFLNVTARRRPLRPRTEGEESCCSLGMSWNKEGATFSPESSPSVASPSVASPSVASPSVASPSVASPSVASPSVASPSVASPSVASPSVASPSVASCSAGSSTTSYLGLPESYGCARLEARVMQWREESALFYNQLLSKPRGLCASASHEKGAVVAAQGDSPLQSPGSLDTAFIETSPPCCESSVCTPPSLRSDPDGSSPLGATPAAAQSPISDREGSEGGCSDRSDESPLGNVFDQVPRARPPSTVRMLANQEVLIPHQLSTIAEIDSSISSTATRNSNRSSGSSGSSMDSCDQGPISEAKKGAQKIFMDLEDKVKAIEAEINSISYLSPTAASSGLRLAQSSQEVSLLMNVTEPTLVPADAITLMLSPHHESSASDSLLSFIRHEESIALADLRVSNQPTTS